MHPQLVLLLVPPAVKRQVVRPAEPAPAGVAPERLGPRVLPKVPGQLVRPGEPPPASGPRAQVRLLASVRPLMGLQVAGLGVHLVAVLEEAAVNPPPRRSRAGSSSGCGSSVGGIDG